MYYPLLCNHTVSTAIVQSQYNLDEILAKHWSHQALYKNLITMIPYFHDDDNYLIDSVDILIITQDSLITTQLDDECIADSLLHG